MGHCVAEPVLASWCGLLSLDGLRPKLGEIGRSAGTTQIASAIVSKTEGTFMKALLLLALIFEAVFGVGFMLAPAAVLAPLGATPNALAIAIARLFGSALLGFAVLLWLARKSGAAEFRRAVVGALFTYNLLCTLLLFQIQLAALLNAMGWGVLATHAAFTLAFGYFLMKR